MKREKIIQRLQKEGVVTIIRMEDAEKVKNVVEAIFKGGLSAIEITMSVQGAIPLIQDVSAFFQEKICLGVGTVLNVDTVHRAVDAGAEYIVSPILKKEMIDAAHERDVPIFPGCMTPTEMQQAYEWGADFIKVFPAASLGMEFMKLVRVPLPHLKLAPTGGVTPQNVHEWFDAGATILGVGSAILDKKAIQEDNYTKITENTLAFKEAISSWRLNTSML